MVQIIQELQRNLSLASALPTSSLLITNTKGFYTLVIRSLGHPKGLIIFNLVEGVI